MKAILLGTTSTRALARMLNDAHWTRHYARPSPLPDWLGELQPVTLH